MKFLKSIPSSIIFLSLLGILLARFDIAINTWQFWAILIPAALAMSIWQASRPNA